jgi:hypothetical protein
MVHRGDSGLYTVDEPNPWRLVKVLQEQQETIDALKAAHDRLRKEIDVLTADAAR